MSNRVISIQTNDVHICNPIMLDQSNLPQKFKLIPLNAIRSIQHTSKKSMYICIKSYLTK